MSGRQWNEAPPTTPCQRTGHHQPNTPVMVPLSSKEPPCPLSTISCFNDMSTSLDVTSAETSSSAVAADYDCCDDEAETDDDPIDKFDNLDDENDRLGDERRRTSGTSASSNNIPLLEEDTESSMGNSFRIPSSSPTPQHRPSERLPEFDSKSRRVTRAKLLVFGMLVTAAVLVVVLIYHFTKSEEVEDFEVQYETFAAKVGESISHRLDMKVWTAYTLSAVFTSRFETLGNGTEGNSSVSDHMHETGTGDNGMAMDGVHGTMGSSMMINGTMHGMDHHGTNGTHMTNGTNKELPPYLLQPSWPHVTMPDFAHQTSGTLFMAHADAVTFSPLLTPKTLASWERYATSTLLHQNEVDLDLHHRHHDNEDLSLIQSEGIYGIDADGERYEVEEGEGYNYHHPVWQVATGSPMNPTPWKELLLDEYTDPIRRQALDVLIETGKPSLTDVCPESRKIHQDPDNHDKMPHQDGMKKSDGMMMDTNGHDRNLRSGHDHTDHTAHMRMSDTSRTMLYFPIFRNFGETKMSETPSTVVGSVGIKFRWFMSLVDMLPEHTPALCVVIANSAGTKMTYHLHGRNVEFLGRDDYHEERFKNMEVKLTYALPDVTSNMLGYHNHRRTTMRRRTVKMEGFESGRTRRMKRKRRARENFFNPRMGESGDSSSTTGSSSKDSPHMDRPMDHGQASSGHDPDEVTYEIRIYPTSSFEDEYLTNRPVVLASVVALIFFFTSMTFIVYDCLVEHRQNMVMKRAVQSSNIVHSLFPPIVRERLFNINDQKEAEQNHHLAAAVADGHHRESNVHANGPRGHRPKELVSTLMEAPTVRLKTFLQGGGKLGSHYEADTSVSSSFGGGEPIADLFSDTTILFADIAGFTAWSSEREPQQVFQLLENVYMEFDSEAKKHKVFKIETIGDCFVAATGLPDPQLDHAVVMVKFAQRCLMKFREVTEELELSLGPGTADLGIRIGVHSGPVTAGVLRGEKYRFQLFGDTMNTASRMESSGKKNMIQASQETADLLRISGKGHWIVPREETVNAKGKGELQTYWLRARPRKVNRRASGSMQSLSTDSEACYATAGRRGSPTLSECGRRGSSTMSDCDDEWCGEKPMVPKVGPTFKRGRSEGDEKDRIHSSEWISSSWGVGSGAAEGEYKRMIQWNAAVLENLLEKVVAHRGQQRGNNGGMTAACSIRNLLVMPNNKSTPRYVLDQISEAAEFPHYKARSCGRPVWGSSKGGGGGANKGSPNASSSSAGISDVAKAELNKYVARIASMYRSVHFHNFEHASHVTMSANKLMKKVCARNWTGVEQNENCTHCTNNSEAEKSSPQESNRQQQQQDGTIQSHLFFKTFGISFDPLAQFAVVFAALIHDVDHTGAPNMQVIREDPNFADLYQNKSVAEQNSIYVAWTLLMEPDFSNLRNCIFANEVERNRFRQLLFHVIIATDIADRNRMQLEKKRWEKAFGGDAGESWESEWREKPEEELAKIDVSLRATIVLEQLMLASDVAHTMQHWLTYIKWNERLFKEMWTAYVNGRSEKDPSVGWYEGEIGFFDGYIIPLATRLKECGVFGTAGDEYLGYALKNREEWVEKGKGIVSNYVESVKEQSPSSSSATSSSQGGDTTKRPTAIASTMAVI